MNIWLVVVVITVMSVILSVISLRDLENKSHLGQVKKKLSKGRVVFHRV